MEELTGILFVVAAIILKVVEAKFKNAAKKDASQSQQRPVRPKVTYTTEEVPKWLRDLEQAELDPEPEPVEPKSVEVQPVVQPVTISFEEAQKPIKPIKAKALNQQDEEKKTGEKIDPKKLIVYSEIMNRKY